MTSTKCANTPVIYAAFIVLGVLFYLGISFPHIKYYIHTSGQDFGQNFSLTFNQASGQTTGQTSGQAAGRISGQVSSQASGNTSGQSYLEDFNNKEYHKSLWKNSSIHPDEHFTPILKLFQQKAKGKLQPKITKFRSGSMPRVLLWSSHKYPDNYWNERLSHIKNGICPLPCEVVFDVKKIETVDGVVIDMRNSTNSTKVMKNLSPRDPNQPWIALSTEALPVAKEMYETKFHELNGLFNRTMMFRKDADIMMLTGFVIPRKEEYTKILPKSWILPPPPIGNASSVKKLAVAMISNCNASSHRLEYIHKMQEYGQVDIYGKCGKLKCGAPMRVATQYNVTQDTCLKKMAKNYLFYLAFENSFCYDYYTEKVFNLLYYRVVPVVRGSADYRKILPPNSYIDATQYTPAELMKKLLYLKSNPEEYQKFLEWREYYQSSTLGGRSSLCYLCSRLYDPDMYEHKVIEDFDDFFVKKYRCIL